MNPISLYYLHFENIKKYLSRVQGKNQSVVFNRVPLLRNIHTKWIQNVVYRICTILEPFVSLIIVTALLFPWCVMSVIKRRQPLSDTLYIDNCPLLKGRTVSAGKYEESIDWLYSFDVNKKDWDRTKRCHSLFEYVTILNVLQSYVLSVISILGAQTKLKFKFVFRTFNSFEFFLTYYFLKNIPQETTICFCNQMDRWAILFDHSPQKNKVLFQHGIEMPTADWPVKFEHTDTVYVLSMEESELLFKAAFKVRPPNVFLLKPTIELTPMVGDKNFKVLIVGYPSYLRFEKELAIVKAFAKEGNSVYLKPHPGKEDMTTYLNLEKEFPNCKIILERMFPDVDVVVSYRSTLAVEYQALNKSVFMYEINTIDEIIEKINELKNKA